MTNDTSARPLSDWVPPTPHWSEVLRRGRPVGGGGPTEATSTIRFTVGGGDNPSHPGAVKLALRAPDIVAAWSDPTRHVANRYALLDMLRAVKETRQDLEGLEESLILLLRDRQEATEGDGASWGELAALYTCDRSTMRARVSRMRDALARGTTAAWDREADPQYWKHSIVLGFHERVGWQLVGGVDYVVETYDASVSDAEALAHAGDYLRDLFGQDVCWVREAPDGYREAWRATLVAQAPYVDTADAWVVKVYGDVALIWTATDDAVRWVRHRLQVGIPNRRRGMSAYPPGNSGPH